MTFPLKNSDNVPVDTEKLPLGTRFAFWEDTTIYRRVYHVAQQHPAASDSNPGTAERPFRTINIVRMKR